MSQAWSDYVKSNYSRVATSLPRSTCAEDIMKELGIQYRVATNKKARRTGPKRKLSSWQEFVKTNSKLPPYNNMAFADRMGQLALVYAQIPKPAKAKKPAKTRKSKPKIQTDMRLPLVDTAIRRAPKLPIVPPALVPKKTKGSMAPTGISLSSLKPRGQGVKRRRRNANYVIKRRR